VTGRPPRRHPLPPSAQQHQHIVEGLQKSVSTGDLVLSLFAQAMTTSFCASMDDSFEGAAVAAAQSVNPERWSTGSGEVRNRIGARLTRHEPRRHTAPLILGLMLTWVDFQS
jgi:hypothetical protein